MATSSLDAQTNQSLFSELPKAIATPPWPTGKFTMYAIAFDLDTEMLKTHYGNDSFNNAYADIRKTLTTKYNFKWQQGSVYLGDPKKVNAVTCVLATQELARTFAWFALSVTDIRMLRIEEENDLMGAVQAAAIGK